MASDDELQSRPLLTTREVADLLRVHPKHVYRLLRRGLPARRVGDEWRFERAEVLRWTAAKRPLAPLPPEAATTTRTAESASGAPPPLLAANGDCAIELVLELLQAAGGPLFGLVLSDHGRGAELLRNGRVLVAGQHGDVPTPTGEKWARVHLVTREVGLVARARSRRPLLDALAGRKFATRPVTAGVRRRLDSELTRAGGDLARIERHSTEHASHRDVVLAVSSGQADVGLATAAWANRAKLAFQPIASEPYELVLAAERLGDARVIALCELLQGASVRRQLRSRFGYDVRHTGELRLHPGAGH